MNPIVFLIPLLLVISIPVAFGQTPEVNTTITQQDISVGENVVITEGQNFKLIENYDIGSATMEIYKDRIMNSSGSWQNYVVSETNDKIIFNTNIIGSFVYDKSSCSYSIYENGYVSPQTQILPSVSIVGTSEINGVWQNLSVNNEACSVSLNQEQNGITITSIKTLYEDTTIDTFHRYDGNESTINVNGTSYNIIRSENSTFYIIPENIGVIETQKLSHIIELDITKGIKETFRLYNFESDPLGISQTIHTGETITINNETINIAQYNGQTFDREFIVANQAEILEIADGLNYDFDIGINSLDKINIIFEDNTYKINMDYADGSFINQLYIDPTFTLTASSNVWTLPVVGTLIVDSATIDGVAVSGSSLTSLQTALNTNVATWEDPNRPMNKLYKFHTDGTITFTGSGNPQFLLVGGGGRGGAGGGGAGGVLQSTTSVSAGTYAVTVGQGAIATPYTQGGVTSGSSSFAGFIAGGGGNGGYNGVSGGAGASGSGTGGAGGDSYFNIGSNGGTYCTPTDNGKMGLAGGGSGGGSGGDTCSTGGGGGGAGANGVVAGHLQSVAGGIGVLKDITGSNVYYGGGGGGGRNGAGGLGGGGTGNGVAPTDRLGGGAGGHYNTHSSSGTLDGGDGVVYIKTTVPSTVTGAFSTVILSSTTQTTLAFSYTLLTVPSAPINLTTVSAVHPIINWGTPTSDGYSAITGYKIFRSINSDGTGATQVGSVNVVLTFTDTTVVSGTAYYYSVKAVNAIGDSVFYTPFIFTQVLALPNAPTGLTSTIGNNGGGIALSWTPSTNLGFGSLISMRIERDSGAGFTMIANTTNTSPPYTDTTTVYSTSYNYRVASVNQAGVGAYSNIVTQVSGTPPSAIANVVATIPDPNNAPFGVSVTFPEPSSWGTGTPQSYQVFESLTGNSGWTQVANPNYVAGQTTTTFTITNGLPNTLYYYKVLAVATHGTSTDSNVSSITTVNIPAVPNAPTLAINNPNPNPFNITLTWTAPASNGGSTITGYTILKSSDDITFTAVTTTSNLTYTDTVASAGTWYYKINAINLVGTSANSNSVNIATPTVPVSDSSVSLTIINPNPSPLTFTVIFIAPSSNGGSAITGYNLFSSPDNITYTQVASAVTAPQTVTVANAGTWYFKSQSINNVGTSAQGSAVSLATPTIPSAPISPTSVIANINSTPYAVTVSWNLPASNGGSAITGYNIYRQTGAGGFSLITNTNLLTILNTVPSAINQDYTFKIYAVNNVGESSNFATTTITTYDVPDAPILSFESGTTSISWTVPSSDATITSYKIYRDSVYLVSTNAGVTSYTDWSPITFGNSYAYEVKAVSIIGDGISSNSITTTPEVLISGMIIKGITGKGAVIDWDEPAYYQGQVTNYQVYYKTPCVNNSQDMVLVGNTQNTYSNFAPTLSYNTCYTFSVKVTSALGNSNFGNLVTGTTTVNQNIITYDPSEGEDAWFDIDAVNDQQLKVVTFTRTQVDNEENGTGTLLQVNFPSWWDDLTCDLEYKFAQTSEQYVDGEDMTSIVNPNNADENQVMFQFNGLEDEIIDVQCAPQYTPNNDASVGRYVVTQQNALGNPTFPILTQMANFQDGTYGTEGQLGALDLLGLCIILVSMVGFNRVSPIVGVILSASIIFALGFFGVVQIATAVVGVIALIIFIAWGMHSRNQT